jgi:hypothetical protein
LQPFADAAMPCPCCQFPSTLPGHVEAALQFLRFAEEIRQPLGYDANPRKGRELSKTEAEVHDSALTVLLDYFNQPITPPTGPSGATVGPSDPDDPDEIPF